MPHERQSLLFHSRERRRSLGGTPELFRTHDFGIPTASIAAGSFAGSLTSPVTFATSILVTGATPAGLIFEFGDAATAIAAWVDDSTLSFRAGDAAAADRGIATYDNTVSLPVGLRLNLVFACLPGDGRVRIWGNGLEIARGVASGGSLPLGWSADSAGAFAAAASGALPADVLEVGAPSSFEVAKPLSAYTKQAPRHFV